MKISKEEALKQVIEALDEISEIKGIVITPEMNPIENLALDSGHGIPFACELEVRLSIEIPVGVNPFVEDIPVPRARTVGEIADLLVKLSENQVGGNNG